MSPSTLLLFGGLSTSPPALAEDAPADRLPEPRPEPCMIFQPELSDDDMAVPNGLSYEEVRTALNGVIQTALHCGRPEGRASIGLTYELVVGCDGIVSDITCTDTDDAPDSYVQCVMDVLEKADFNSHDMADGMPITYPVNVSW